MSSPKEEVLADEASKAVTSSQELTQEDVKSLASLQEGATENNQTKISPVLADASRSPQSSIFQHGTTSPVNCEATSKTNTMPLNTDHMAKEESNKRSENGLGISKTVSEKIRQLASGRQAANQAANQMSDRNPAPKVAELTSAKTASHLLPAAGGEASSRSSGLMELTMLPTVVGNILPSANAEQSVAITNKPMPNHLSTIGGSINPQSIRTVLPITTSQSILPHAINMPVELNAEHSRIKMMEVDPPDPSSSVEEIRSSLSEVASPTFMGPKLSISWESGESRKSIKRKEMEKEEDFLQARPLPAGAIPVLTAAQMETSHVKINKPDIKVVPPRKRPISMPESNTKNGETSGHNKGKKMGLSADEALRQHLAALPVGPPPPPPPPQPRNILSPTNNVAESSFYQPYTNKKMRMAVPSRPTSLASLGTVNLSSLPQLSAGLAHSNLPSGLNTVQLSQGTVQPTVMPITSTVSHQQINPKNIGQVMINSEPLIVIPQASVGNMSLSSLAPSVSPLLHHKSGMPSLPLPMVASVGATPLTTFSLQKVSPSQINANTADSGIGNTMISLPMTPTCLTGTTPLSSIIPISSTSASSQRHSYSPVSSETSSDSENLPSMVGAASPVHIIMPEGVHLEDRKPYIDAMGRATDAHHEVEDMGQQMALKTIMFGSPGGVANTSPGKSEKAFGPFEPEQNPEMEIQLFVDQYQLMKPGGDRREVPVKKLRRFIPLLIMHLYGMKYAEQVRKVKGLWEKPPSDWPVELPFCDPNNAPRDHRGIRSGKPKKETLNKMFYYLLHRYMEQQKSLNSSDPKDQNIPCFADSMPPSLERYKSVSGNNTVADELRKYRIPVSGSGRPIQETGDALPMSTVGYSHNSLRLQNSLPNMNIPVSTPVQETKPQFSPLPGAANFPSHNALSPNNPIQDGHSRTFVLLHSDKTNNTVPSSSGVIRHPGAFPGDTSHIKTSQPLLQHSLISPNSSRKATYVSQAPMANSTLSHVLPRPASNLSVANPTLCRTLGAKPQLTNPISESYVATSQGMRMLPDVNALLSKSVPAQNSVLPMPLDQVNDSGQGENSQDGSRKLEAIEGILMLTQSKPPTIIPPPPSRTPEPEPIAPSTPRVPVAAHQSSLSRLSTGGDHPQPLALVARLLQMETAAPAPNEGASDDDKWDVVRSVLERVDEKIERLRSNKQLQDKLMGMLLLARDCLRTMQVNHKTEDFGYTLEKSHELECTAELALVNNHIPGLHALKWHEFSVSHGRRCPLITKIPGGVNGIVGYCLEETTPTHFAKCVNDKLDKYDDMFPYEKPMVWEVTEKLKKAEDINKYFEDLNVDVPNYDSATIVDVNVLNIQLRQPCNQQELEVPIQECGEDKENKMCDEDTTDACIDKSDLQMDFESHSSMNDANHSIINQYGIRTNDASEDIGGAEPLGDVCTQTKNENSNGDGKGRENNEMEQRCEDEIVDTTEREELKSAAQSNPWLCTSGDALTEQVQQMVEELVSLGTNLNGEDYTIALPCTEGTKQNVGDDNEDWDKNATDVDLMLSLPADIGNELDDYEDWASMLGNSFSLTEDAHPVARSEDSVTDVVALLAAVNVNDHAIKADHPYASPIQREVDNIQSDKMGCNAPKAMCKANVDILSDGFKNHQQDTTNPTPDATLLKSQRDGGHIFKRPITRTPIVIVGPKPAVSLHHTLGNRQFVGFNSVAKVLSPKTPSSSTDVLSFPQQESCSQTINEDDQSCIILSDNLDSIPVNSIRGAIFLPTPQGSLIHPVNVKKTMPTPVCEKRSASVEIVVQKYMADVVGTEEVVETCQSLESLGNSAQPIQQSVSETIATKVKECLLLDGAGSFQQTNCAKGVENTKYLVRHCGGGVISNDLHQPAIQIHSTDVGYPKQISPDNIVQNAAHLEMTLASGTDGNYMQKKNMQNVSKRRIVKSPTKGRRTMAFSSAQNRLLLPKIDVTSDKRDADLASSIGAMISGMGHTLTPQLVGDITHLVRHLYPTNLGPSQLQ